MNTLDELAAAWLSAKLAETNASILRRQMEDRLLSLIGISETNESTTNIESIGGFKIKITSRIDRKVNGDKVQELAAEYGLTEHLGSLFRWKPEINTTVWKKTNEAITKPLAAAITAKPGRPSFTIIRTEK